MNMLPDLSAGTRLNSLALALAATASLGVAAVRMQSSSPAVPATTSPDSEPTFMQTQDIGNRFELDTWFQSSDPLVDPSTSASTKVVSVILEVRYGLASLELIHTLDARGTSDVTPLSFLVGGLDVSTAVPSQPPGTAFEYQITVQPKPGYTWYSAEMIQHLQVDAVQQ